MFSTNSKNIYVVMKKIGIQLLWNYKHSKTKSLVAIRTSFSFYLKDLLKESICSYKPINYALVLVINPSPCSSTFSSNDKQTPKERLEREGKKGDRCPNELLASLLWSNIIFIRTTVCCYGTQKRTIFHTLHCLSQNTPTVENLLGNFAICVWVSCSSSALTQKNKSKPCRNKRLIKPLLVVRVGPGTNPKYGSHWTESLIATWKKKRKRNRAQTLTRGTTSKNNVLPLTDATRFPPVCINKANCGISS